LALKKKKKKKKLSNCNKVVLCGRFQISINALLTDCFLSHVFTGSFFLKIMQLQLDIQLFHFFF